MTNKFSIEKMYQDEEYFRQFIKELKYFGGTKFQRNYRNPSEVVERICDLNTSCDIYAEIDGIYECNSDTSKKIHDEFGSDDDHEVNCYIEAEIRSGKQVKLYCKYYLQDWDEEEETYTMCSTGDYYAIELD